MHRSNAILILYDGNCPLCCRQMHFLKKRDRRQTLNYLNIRSSAFSPEKVGVTAEALATQIYVQLPDQRLLCGMEAVRAMYTQIGLGWLIAPTGWPLLRPLFNQLYRFVAKHRLKISRLLPRSPRP